MILSTKIRARLRAKKEAIKRMDKNFYNDHVLDNLIKMTKYIDKKSWDISHNTNTFKFIFYVAGTGNYFFARKISRRSGYKLIRIPEFLKYDSCDKQLEWYKEYFLENEFDVQYGTHYVNDNYVYVFDIIVPEKEKHMIQTIAANN